MFCTSLRRRPSFAAGVPSMSKAPLNLRESQLKTHDLEITIDNPVRPATSNACTNRQLRTLLLSRSAVSDDKLDATLERIQHFVSLTGGEDLLIIFLLNPPKDTNFRSAKDVARNSVNDTEAGQDAIVVYVKLQTEMVNQADIPHVPVRPILTLNDLSSTIESHTTALKSQPRKLKPSSTPFALLKMCTVHPPMSEQTAYIISDIFVDIKDLASACSAVSAAPNSSSPSLRAAAFQSSEMYGLDPVASTQSTGGDNTAAEKKLKRLRDLIGEQECQDIIDFWKEEWLL